MRKIILEIIILTVLSMFQTQTMAQTSFPEYKIDLEKSKVYFDNSEIALADITTFILIDKHDYAKDKNYVYYKGTILENADPKTFIRLTTDRTRVNRNDYHIVSYGYCKDKNNVFFNNKIIEEADSESFQERAYGYAEDKNYIYYRGKIYKKRSEGINTFEEPEYEPRLDR